MQKLHGAEHLGIALMREKTGHHGEEDAVFLVNVVAQNADQPPTKVLQLRLRLGAIRAGSHFASGLDAADQLAEVFVLATQNGERAKVTGQEGF